MQHRHVVADHRGLADHDRMGVVDHDPLADHGAGMDVDAECLADPHLDEIGKVAAALQPEPVADPVSLDGLKALEVEKRLHEPMAGRIAIVDGHDIRARRLTERGIGSERLIGDLAQDLLAHLAGRQLQRKPVGQRPFQRRMVEDARVDETAHQRLVAHGRTRLVADVRPDWIDP